MYRFSLHLVSLLLIVGIVLAWSPRAACQQDPSGDRRIRSLVVASEAAAAAESLLAGGFDSRRSLVASLETSDARLRSCIIALLRRFGAASGDVYGRMTARLLDGRLEPDEELITLIADLAPFRGSENEDVDWLAFYRGIQGRQRVLVGPGDILPPAWRRLVARQRVTLETTTEDLVAHLASPRAFIVEAALDVLAERHDDTEALIPLVRGLLARRGDARVLGSSGVVPIRRKGLALLQAWGATERVSDSARVEGSGANNDAVTRRVDELVMTIGRPALRAESMACLAALGPLASARLGARLPDLVADERVAIVECLRAMGPGSGGAAPALFQALPSASAEALPEVLEAMALAAPWSWDIVPELRVQLDYRVCAINGCGTRWRLADGALASVDNALCKVRVASESDPVCPPREFREMLTQCGALAQEIAMSAVVFRGDARDFVGELMAMTRCENCVRREWAWPDGGFRQDVAVDYTERVQRMAAQTVARLLKQDGTRK